MKKIMIFTLTFVLVASAVLDFNRTKAESPFGDTFNIPYNDGTIVIDGIISEGEYSASNTMDNTTAEAWVGEVGASASTWHIAWDEKGIYYASTINDTTPVYRGDDEYWVGYDALEFAVNPGNVLKNNEEGIFFSFGAKADGSVVAYRHNFADGVVSDIVTAKAGGHVEGSESYTIEVLIPWSLIQIDERCTIAKKDYKINAGNWTPEEGAKFSFLVCSIDYNPAINDITGAYKYSGTDFEVNSYISGVLAGKDAENNIAQTNAPTDETSENKENNSTKEYEDVDIPEITGVDEAYKLEVTKVVVVAAVICLACVIVLIIAKRKKK